MKTGLKKIFFDTAPFIYIIENHHDLYSKVAKFISDSVEENSEFYTSVLTYSEFCVKPEEIGRPDLITSFEDLLQDLNFTILEIKLNSAKLAYKSRSTYKFLKDADSLQISIAINSNCQQFFTNDKNYKI